LRRATVSSHASGVTGIPRAGQSTRAEGVGQGILCPRDISGPRREKSDQLAVAAASHRLGDLAGVQLALSLHRAFYMTQIGRTSTAP
jgi:hypothetical protein